MVATTTSVALTSADWTLIADGSAGAASCLIQLATVAPALVHLAASAPSAASVVGITINHGEAPFAASLLSGQKVYAKAQSTATTVVAMVG